MVVKEELLDKKLGLPNVALTNLVMNMTKAESDAHSPTPADINKGTPHPHDIDYHHLYHGMGFYDDVHGESLEKELAIQARKLEMDFFRRMQVYSKVDRSVAKHLGAKVITPRWIDTNKGDECKPD